MLALVFAALSFVEALQDPPKPPPPQDPHSPDAIITASRLVENPQEVGSSTSVIQDRDLEIAQRRFVLDALREVPGLDVVTNGPFGGTASVFIRGANSEHTLLLIDGIEVHDAASAGRAFDFGHLTTDQIDRIEVIRGPQSVLYGSDAIGGVIHVISPYGHGEPRFLLMAEAGSYASYRAAASVSGGNDRVHYSIGGSRLQTGGFSAAGDELDGNDEDDGYRGSTLAAKVGITPSKIFQMDLVIRTEESRAEIDNFGGAFGDDPNNTNEFSQWAFKVEPRLTLFDGFWEQALAIKFTEIRRQNDNLPDAASIERSFSSFDSRIADVDWQHNFIIHPNDVVTVGAEIEEDQASTSFFSDGFGPPFASVLRKVDAWTRGAYLQNRLHLGEVFTTTAGVRADTHEEFGSHATWRLTGALLPVAGTKLRGSVGTGFKAPSIFQLYSSFGNLDLEPEESLGWDVGVDQAVGDTLAFSATYFRNEFEDLILFDSPSNRYVNIGRADTEGAEFAARLRVHAAAELSASYTVTRTEDKTIDEELLRRPRHKGSLRATITPEESFHASLGVVYVGSRDDLDFSTFPAATRVKLDDYWLGQLALSWTAMKELELFARVDNLFDQEYVEVTGFGVAELSAYAGASLRF
ncbi:MAG TPA: TonB-dependent receptor [Planctomycetota bacterium]